MKKYMPIAIILVIVFMSSFGFKSYSSETKNVTQHSMLTKNIVEKQSPRLLLQYPTNEEAKLQKTKNNQSETVSRENPSNSQEMTNAKTENPSNIVQSNTTKSLPTNENAKKWGFAFIKTNVKIGLPQVELVSLIGTPDVIGLSAMDGMETWRYDFNKKEDYIFEELDEFKDMGIVDTVDLNGILDDKLGMQLFIQWKDGKVSHITCYNKRDQTIWEYRVFESGEERETAIQ